MRFAHTLRLAVAAGLGAAALTAVGFGAPAQARVADPGSACLVPTSVGPAAAARGGTRGVDHRGISAAEQLAISRRTDTRLAAKGTTGLVDSAARAGRRTVPVHVHVMRDRAGRGDVTNRQIRRQVRVLNRDYRSIGYHFALRGIHRYNNTAWHNDRHSRAYRAKTRRGGARTLNIWLVDFQYLGVASFPWDYRKQRAVDGIRVNYDSLPGGSILHYNRGKTATHELGHWFGLYHTFQSGCTPVNDEVGDTPAQSTPTSGCPAGRDSCPMPGTDPIHNFMDYSFDTCYRSFTRGQAARAHKMWAAYRT
jgi:hypothetical protein